MRTLVMILALALFTGPAHAAAPVELEAGQPAPFKGSLCDLECASRIAARVMAAQDSRDKCLAELQAKPSGAPSILLPAGIGAVVGILVGVAVAAIVIKKT